MKETLSLKEKIALKLIFLALKIMNPFQYSHELSKPLEEIEKLIKAED